MSDHAAEKAYIRQQALIRHLDPQAVAAVGSREGYSGGIGDGGHAFGPWQLNNAGGVITGMFRGQSPGQINQWAWSKAGINYALDRIAKVASGMHGQEAIKNIVTRFERPAAPGQEIAGSIAAYGTDAAPVAPAGSKAASLGAAPVMGAGPTGGLSDKHQLLLGLLGQNEPSVLTSLLSQHLAQKEVQPATPTFKNPLGPAPAQSGAYPGVAGTYKFLHTEGGASLDGVNPRLLAAAERLAEAEGKPLTVASGYRDYQKQAALYQRYVSSGYNRAYIAAKPGQSNHEHGNALDLLIDGRPIDSLGAATLAKYGLHNGVPGDHPHTTLIGVNG